MQISSFGPWERRLEQISFGLKVRIQPYHPKRADNRPYCRKPYIQNPRVCWRTGKWKWPRKCLEFRRKSTNTMWEKWNNPQSKRNPLYTQYKHGYDAKEALRTYLIVKADYRKCRLGENVGLDLRSSRGLRTGGRGRPTGFFLPVPLTASALSGFPGRSGLLPCSSVICNGERGKGGEFRDSGRSGPAKSCSPKVLERAQGAKQCGQTHRKAKAARAHTHPARIRRSCQAGRVAHLAHHIPCILLSSSSLIPAHKVNPRHIGGRPHRRNRPQPHTPTNTRAPCCPVFSSDARHKLPDPEPSPFPLDSPAHATM